MLVEFDCGCIGFPEPVGSKHRLVWICEGGERAYGPTLRYMSNKSSEPCSEEREAEIWSLLDSLIERGYRYNEVRNLFSLPNLNC
jgi:hypothetical protein